MKFNFWIPILVVLLISPSLVAKRAEHTPAIKIGSYLTPGLITNDGSGLFNQLNQAIFAELSGDMQLNISSIKRARKGISDGTLDAYFPELWEKLPGDRNQYVVSSPIFYKQVVLFTLADSELTKLTEFDDQLIGVVKGFSYGEKITANKSLNLLYQDNDMTNIRMLLNGRIQGVLGGFPGTVLAVHRQQAKPKVHYDLYKPESVLESFYVCENSQKGRALCDDISKAIRVLQQKGILELNHQTGFSRFKQFSNTGR